MGDDAYTRYAASADRAGSVARSGLSNYSEAPPLTSYPNSTSIDPWRIPPDYLPKKKECETKEMKSLQGHGGANYEQWRLELSWSSPISTQLQAPLHRLEVLYTVLHPFLHSPIHICCEEHSKLPVPSAGPAASPPSVSAGTATVPSAEQTPVYPPSESPRSSR